jgi:hypothetical protein
MIPPSIVSVLGAPRSGTSLTANIVSTLGVYLGSEQRLENPALKVHNPKGYFEHETIWTINREILLRFSHKQGYLPRRGIADWASFPTLPENWEKSQELCDLRAQALELVRTDFIGHEVWGWKDPPTVFTLPFWQDFLPPIHYVICLRHPVDTAQSIMRFLDCTFERGLYLWALHLHFAFKNTVGMERIVVRSESWIDGWQEQTTRLAKFLGKPDLADQSEIHEAIRQVVDGSLWHHRSATACWSAAVELYELISESDVGSSDDFQREFKDVLEDIAPDAIQADKEKTKRDHDEWMEQLPLAVSDIIEHTPLGSRVILVDDACLGQKALNERAVIPFMERDGRYWGSPANCEEAVSEFRRLHRSGAEYIVFVWSSFWWLEIYPDLSTYLKSRFRCIFKSDRIILFDLREQFEAYGNRQTSTSLPATKTGQIHP